MKTQHPSPANQPNSSPELSPAPKIIAEMQALEINYYGFDGEVHQGNIEVNQEVAEDIKAFFELAYELKFPIDKIVKADDQEYGSDDTKLMADNATSGFNYRFVAGSDRLSQHARGLAIDINPRQNPCFYFSDGKTEVRPAGAVWDPSVPGTLSAEHPLTRLMISKGWEWGGNWTQESGRIDYQHFQKA